MKKTVLLALLLMIAAPISAQSIGDVSKGDPAYSSIRKSVKGGYLSLFEGNQFNGSNSITRKEAAVVIDKLLDEVHESRLELNKAEVQELLSLSNSFKNYLENSETRLNSLEGTHSQLGAEQRVLNHDVSRVNEELQTELNQLKKDNQNQQLFMWIGIAAAAIVGIAI